MNTRITYIGAYAKVNKRYTNVQTTISYCTTHGKFEGFEYCPMCGNKLKCTKGFNTIEMSLPNKEDIWYVFTQVETEEFIYLIPNGYEVAGWIECKNSLELPSAFDLSIINPTEEIEKFKNADCDENSLIKCALSKGFEVEYCFGMVNYYK